MRLTQVHKLILYSLGQFYSYLNQPLVEKPLTLRTSKITFIEHMLNSQSIGKQERALYKNIEFLEQNKLITYDQRMIRFTDLGLAELEKIKAEIKQFNDIENYFKNAEKPKRKLQTVIS
jgi:hypothetical protein